ncbi:MULTISPECIES: LPXTG cell wall anchor domain-containing protein, partial [unclassified Enterococcus]|uniref:LPXTG cell wall anchor domain-containing protein n=1 Tax=unclassified Enterococcus TaxID=2608891 RepID=UPI00197DB883
KRIVILIILILFCLLGGIFAWFFISSPSEDVLKEDTNAVGYNSNLKKPKDFTSDQIAFPGFSEIKVKEGSKLAPVLLENPSFNKVYFKYIVTFDETGEKLLQTDLIAPGKAIKEMPLPKNLSVGKHLVTIAIKTYNKKTKSELNSGSHKTFLIVESSATSSPEKQDQSIKNQGQSPTSYPKTNEYKSNFLVVLGVGLIISALVSLRKSSIDD